VVARTNPPTRRWRLKCHSSTTSQVPMHSPYHIISSSLLPTHSQSAALTHTIIAQIKYTSCSATTSLPTIHTRTSPCAPSAYASEAQNPQGEAHEVRKNSHSVNIQPLRPPAGFGPKDHPQTAASLSKVCLGPDCGVSMDVAELGPAVVGEAKGFVSACTAWGFGPVAEG